MAEEKRLSGLGFAVEPEEVFTNFSAATSGIKPYLTTRTTIDPADIAFVYNGKAEFNIGQKDIHTTKYGLLSLCKLLQIPNPFANLIPLDLLQTNIKRLASAASEEIQMTQDANGAIVGFNTKDYAPLRTLDLLLSFDSRFTRSSENVKIVINPRNCVVQFTSTAMKPLEPHVGDITKCGVEVTNSEVADLKTSAQLFLLRLACTNGAVMTENWGKVRRSNNKKLQYDTILEQFVTGCTMLLNESEDLQRLFTSFANLSLKSNQFVTTYKQLHPLMGHDAAAQMLLSDKDEAKDFVDFEKKRTHWSIAGSDWYGHAPRDTEKNAYDVFNNITETARDMTNMLSARKMRVVSGKYLTMLSRSLAEEN